MFNLVAPINKLGYGNVGLNIANQLFLKSRGAALQPIGPIEIDKEYEECIQTLIKNGEFYNPELPCVRIYHQNSLNIFFKTKRAIGFPIFELDKLTPVEKWHIKNVDKLIVCSEWAKRVIRDNLKEQSPQIDVVPLGVDLTTFFPTTLNKNPESPTVFINIGKWEVRKGHDILIEIFEKAFGPNDNVELWMVNENPFYTPQETAKFVSKYKWSPLASKIRIIPRLSSQKELAALTNRADCAIFPTRAEGWNLEALESLACGKILITTNYSGHTEFVNKQNAMLVDIDELEPAYDNKWFYGQGNWAKIDSREISQFADYMVAVHDIKRRGDLFLNLPGIETAKSFTWEHSFNCLKEAVRVFDLK